MQRLLLFRYHEQHSDSAALIQPFRITTPVLWCFHSEKNCEPGGPLALLSAATKGAAPTEAERVVATHTVFRAIAAAYLSHSAEEATDLRIFLTCVGLAGALALLIIFLSEKQQEAALERLSSYKLNPQPALYDDADLKQVTARSPYMRNE